MLKTKLKKYKFLYRGYLIINANHNNDNCKYAIKKHRSVVIIVDINSFHKHINNRKYDSYELWTDSPDKYCNLALPSERKRMIFPAYSETKIYCESDENLYDVIKRTNIPTFVRRKEAVFNDIMKSYEGKQTMINLRKQIDCYVDEINIAYDELNKKTT